MANPPAPAETPQRTADLDVGGDFEGLRWFLLPAEAAAEPEAETAETAEAPAEGEEGRHDF